MLRDTISRALRLGSSEEVPALLPDTPTGAIELTHDELEVVTGGSGYSYRSSRRKAHCFSKGSSRRSFKKSKRRSFRQRKNKRSYG